MTTKVQKWGNSLAVRLPKAVTNRLNLRAGSGVAVDQHNDSIIIRRLEMVDISRPLTGKDDWKRYVLPSKSQNKERVSGNIDSILYGANR